MSIAGAQRWSRDPARAILFPAQRRATNVLIFGAVRRDFAGVVWFNFN
jgi:hypothetical protein